MPEPMFDIFAGAPDKDALWLEAVDGLSSARRRMEEIAKANPGRYFVFAVRGHAVLAQIETAERVEVDDQVMTRTA
jgi:hypothetical protein